MGAPDWLEWVIRVQAIAQSGLTYVKDPYDRDRYEQIRDLCADFIARCSGEALERVRDLFVSEEGYATPKVDVRAAAFREGKVLLVREKADGLWTLPGGWADVWETPSQAALKELREESGFEGRILKLAAILDRDAQGHPRCPWRIYKVFFLCEIVGGSPSPDREIEEVGFFDPLELPPLSINRTTQSQVLRMLEHYRNPSLPADFD